MRASFGSPRWCRRASARPVPSRLGLRHYAFLTAGPPQALFTAPFAFDMHDSVLGRRYHSLYDVSPDGQRFLVNERLAAPLVTAFTPGATRAATIAVVVDWMADVEP
jgi:hypothetical protein